MLVSDMWKHYMELYLYMKPHPSIPSKVKLWPILTGGLPGTPGLEIGCEGDVDGSASSSRVAKLGSIGCKTIPSREWIHIPPNGKFGKSSAQNAHFWGIC